MCMIAYDIFRFKNYNYKIVKMYENRDLKQKKYSSGLLKNLPEKPSYLGASKIGPSCPPKNPPNISIYYR